MPKNVEASSDPPVSSSLSNKFDLNQYLICSNHPLSESNSTYLHDQSLVYPSIVNVDGCNFSNNNKGGNQLLTYSKLPTKLQGALNGAPLDPNILNHPSINLYFPKDLDRVPYSPSIATTVTSTTSSSVSQAVRSNSGSTAISSANTGTITTTTTTNASSCKSQISPITFEDFEEGLNNISHSQYSVCQEQSMICWSSDKIHFLDPNLIQEEGDEDVPERGRDVLSNCDENRYEYQEYGKNGNNNNNDYTYRLIAFGSSPPPVQLASHHLVALQNTSSDTLTQHESESSMSVTGNKQTVAMEVKQSSQLLAYHSTSSNVFLDYLKSEEELEKITEMKNKLGLQPAFDFKEVYPITNLEFEGQYEEQSDEEENDEGEQVGNNNHGKLTSLPLSYRRAQLQDLPSSPIVTAQNAKGCQENQQGEETIANSENKEEYGKSPSPQFCLEEDKKYKRRFKKSGELRKNALMIYPITFKFKDHKSEFSQCIQKLFEKMAVQQAPALPSRPSRHTSTFPSTRIAFNPKGATEIYEIGPKVLPQPFSEEFEALKRGKFLPLHVLMTDPEYQLDQGQTTNYNLKTRNKIRCPNRPHSQGDLGPFRVQNIQTRKSPRSPLSSSRSKNKAQPPKHTSIEEGESASTEESSKEIEFKNDRYYSRLNIYELSKILNLHQYSIQLTKLVELNVLEIFGNYCDFQLGYQTWIRDTTKDKRKELIQQLYSYTVEFYPEIDPFKLEVIIRRGSYSLMQTRLRRERRLKQRSRDIN